MSELEDRQLSAEDREDLAHLQMILNLPDDGAAHIREEVLGQLYANSLADALSDGRINPEERSRLDAIAASFGLPDKRVKDIYEGQVLRVLQWRFDQIVTDARVTDIEEAKLNEMAANLGVTLRHDPRTQERQPRDRGARLEFELPLLALVDVERVDADAFRHRFHAHLEPAV